MRKLIQLSLLVAALPVLTGADIYRWVDENGIVNYTQIKPEGVRVDHITTRAGAPSVVSDVTNGPKASAQAQPGTLSDSQQSMLRDLQQVEAQRQEEIARIRQDNCVRSRDVLTKLSAKDRIRIRDDSGKERVMEEEERQRRISEAQRGIVGNCETAPEASDGLAVN